MAAHLTEQLLHTKQEELLDCLLSAETVTIHGQECVLTVIQDITVRNHVARIYNKADVHNRAAAVVWACERGFTGPAQKKGSTARNRD